MCLSRICDRHRILPAREYDGLLDKYRKQMKVERIFTKSELSKENEMLKIEDIGIKRHLAIDIKIGK